MRSRTVLKNIKDEIADKEQEIKKEYEIPPVSLLKRKRKR